MKTAQTWGISLTVDTVEVSKGNVEHQARLSRYTKFRQRLEPGEHVLTAHHRNDDIETVLWQLFTGRATTGIPNQRPLGSGTMLRPLLNVEKQEIEAYAERNGLTWIEDESNTDTNLDRNWIRHELLPQIFGRFPQAKGLIHELKMALLPAMQRGPLELKGESLTEKDVRSWLLAHEVNPPNTVIKEILVQAIARPDANPEIKVSDHLFVRRYRKQLHLVRIYEVFQPLQVTVGDSINLSNGTLAWKDAKQGFEKGCNLLCTNRMHLANETRVIKQDAMHKKLASLFQESSIPPWLRDGWPVLCEGENVVSLVDVVTDGTALGWQSRQAFEPTWHPFD